MPFGLDTAGFNPMRLADVRAQFEADYRAAFGANVRLEDESVNGQMIGVFSERFADVWAQMELVYVSAFLAGATGTALDDLVAIGNVTRLPATYSEVTLTLTGTNGTIIPIGSVSSDAEGERWVHTTAATISGGTATATASPERTGAVLGRAGTITEITTAVSGWTGVTNATDATVGRAVESDAALRTRFVDAIRFSGMAVEGLRAALLRLEDVTEAIVIENETYVVDLDGRPPKSFEAVVRGGDDQEIVDTIWAFKPAGIETYGNNSGTALDSAGDPHTIEFSRATTVDIYVVIAWESLPNVLEADKDAIEAEMLDEVLELGAAYTIGRDVVPFEFIQRIDTVGIRSLEFRVGLSASPPSDDPLTIARTALAMFDSTRVSFERLN